MAKSTRQYVFEGMEVLPNALIPFVENGWKAPSPVAGRFA